MPTSLLEHAPEPDHGRGCYPLVRRGATISAGLFLGLERAAAARYSFLLSIPAIVLSGIYELPQIGDTGGASAGATALATLFAFAVGYASIAFLLRFLTTHTVIVFVYGLRPPRPLLGQRLAQPRHVPQLLDLRRRDPRFGQHLAREQQRQPTRVQTIRLCTPTTPLQRLRLPWIGKPYLEPERLQFGNHPAPAGGRLDRDHRLASDQPLGPLTQPISVSSKPRLLDLARDRIEHHSLEHVLMDVTIINRGPAEPGLHDIHLMP